jgi:hypothetical protein
VFKKFVENQSWEVMCTSVYAGVSVLFALLLHSAYSTYLGDMKVDVGYSMTLSDGLYIGAALAAFVSVAIWLSLSIFIEEEPSRPRSALRSVISFVLMFGAFLIVSYFKVPGWYQVGLLPLVLVPALSVSVAAYWNHRYRGSTYRKKSALERDHQKLVQAVNSFGWLIAFLAATIIYSYFNLFLLQRIPTEYSTSYAASTLLAWYAAGAVVLIGGMAVIILVPLTTRLRTIEVSLDMIGR